MTLDIDQDFINSEAPNANAVSNGIGLVAKGKFVALNRSEDETLIFGECSGSGKSNYACSCDFINKSNPVYRCSCPSRQFPCKHCIGLLHAYSDGKAFTVADVPADITEKREKAEARSEKKKVDASKPKKVNKAALKKKIAAQLQGLDLLEKLTHDLVRTGMGNTNAKTASQVEEHAKQLGNAYLPGAQSALLRYTRLFINDEGMFDAEMSAKQLESSYSQGLDQLANLNALIKKGREYLNQRNEDPELSPETDSPIAAWLGHAWQLSELKAAGLAVSDAELIQLAFNSYDDIARRELVDTGIWMNLNSGQIQLTQNFRPYKAAKYIKAEDSFFKIAKPKELCIYPGDVNPRVRWDELESRPIDLSDLKKIRTHAATDLAALIKSTKSKMKSPLGDKQPIVAINYKKIGELNDDLLVLEDAKGERIVFTEAGGFEEPASCHLLWLLPKEMLSNQTLIGRFHHDFDTQTLQLKPLSIVTKNQIYRLTL